MASNVNAMERTASTGIAYHNFNESGSDVKLTRVSITPKGPDDVEPGNVHQPAGVAQMEAITTVWTRKWLVAAYVLLTIISFTNSLQQQANYSWMPYVTSSFGKHGLTPITSLVANVVSGVSRLPLAQLLNVWGRPQGFAVCLAFVVVSLILMGTCRNVETYFAAQVLYWTGMNGMGFVFDIFIQDTSRMVNRLIYLAIFESPYICNTFAGPELGQRFLDDSTWQWGYGAFAIITPVMCIPFFVIVHLMTRKAQKLGFLRNEKSGRTVIQSVVHWAIEFDLIGVLLLCFGFSLFLLPFGLVAYQVNGWTSPRMIFMIIFGIVLIVVFAVYEKLWAPKAFFPTYLMKDRSIVGACLLGCNGWIAFYCYKMYYSSYLQVVFGLSVAKAGYIANIYNIVACTWALAVSFIFKYTNSFKWGAVIAMPIQLLMTGLLIHFRKPGTHIGFLVMVEVFWAMCGAVLVNVEQVAIFSTVRPEHVANALAMLSMVTGIGGAVGQAISGTIWTHIVPKKLLEYLPEDKKAEARTIYASLPVQLSYGWDTPERQAIVRAYGDAQKFMVIVGTCALVPCFLWVAMLRNSRLTEQGVQKKGVQA
ncbi:major facilitator superfamily domain-containing protein [Paraphoma chrysanthemicola]|nr:major facilitator superfamily domain-containing protein [Paraphoma chrysanthemicola]